MPTPYHITTAGQLTAPVFYRLGFLLSSRVSWIHHHRYQPARVQQVQGLLQRRQGGSRTSGQTVIPAGQISQVEHDCGYWFLEVLAQVLVSVPDETYPVPQAMLDQELVRDS